MFSRRKVMALLGAGATGAFVASACGSNSSVTTGVTPTIGADAAFEAEIDETMLRALSGGGFGRLRPQLPENVRELEQVGNGFLARRLLAVPRGFRYTALSITGQPMSDGNNVPALHDGMACFQNGLDYLLVRNHEIPVGGPLAVISNSVPKYDSRAFGGTTTLVVGRNGLLKRDFVSLAGTVRNCAGGPTPWGSWLSCEETVETPESIPLLNERHGYVFEVPAGRFSIADPVPLRAMGRFRHEAAAVDPATGIVYETEDSGGGCFYRFRPNVRGQLRLGGTLEALRLDPSQVINTGTGFSNQVGRELPVSWVEVEEPDPAEDTVALQAQARNASIFRRGEGAWYGNGVIYFVCTSGGDAGQGQIWGYNTNRNTLTLIYESGSEQELDNPDNVTVGPDGSLFLCEDGDGAQYVAGLTPGGEPFRFALNLLDTREFAGACFSPDGRKLFFNAQGVGITYCVWREDNQPIVL